MPGMKQGLLPWQNLTTIKVIAQGKSMRNFYLLVVFLMSGLFSVGHATESCALSQSQYRIGTEALNFYPHYNFSGEGPLGYGNMVLARFAEFAGIELQFKALPVKRLYHEIDRLVDAVYPDHPRWVHYQGVSVQRYFSEPVATAVGTSLVQASQQAIPLTHVRSLAIIHGFTPVAWLSIQPEHRFRILEVADPPTAVRLLLAGRVDVVDLEYNVARYQLQLVEQLPRAVVPRQLPYTLGHYHLSSANSAELIDCFNLFLQQNQPELAALKATFDLMDTLPFAVDEEQDNYLQ